MSGPGDPPSPQPAEDPSIGPRLGRRAAQPKAPAGSQVRRRVWWRRKPASLYDLSPGSASPDGWGLDRRTRRRRRIRNLVVGVLGFLLLAFLAVLADAYSQSYRTYKDLRGIVPSLTAARHDLAQGELPPGDPIGAASATANRARDDVDHARFTFKLAGVIPFFNRPVQAVRHGVAAAVEETSAASGLRDLVRDALGGAALTGSSTSSSSSGAPIFHAGTANVRLLQTLTPRLARVVSSLRAADRELRAIPSIPYVHALDRLKEDALTQSDQAIKLTTDALAGARLLPGFLGANGTRTYFLAMQNNADLRAPGGSTLAYALLTIKEGKPKLIGGGPIYDLHLPTGGKAIPVPLSPAVAWYIDHVPHQVTWFDSVNFSPDFTKVAPTWVEMVKAVTGRRVDGVILLDPIAVANMLGQDAKLRIPSYPSPITPDNLVSVVENDQYHLPTADQLAFPAQLIAGAWPLISNPNPFIPTVHKMGSSLGQKHLQLWSADPAEESLLRSLGWDGGLRVGTGDYLYVVDNHRGASKTDYFTRTKIAYDVTVLGSGAIRSSLQVTLSNATPEGEPVYVAGATSVYAANTSMMSVFAPGAAALLDSEPPDGLPDHAESGAKVFIRTIVAPPAKPGVLTLGYTVPGAVLTTSTGKVYTLVVQHQPLVSPADLTITVTLPPRTVVRSAPGWAVNGNVATLHTVLDKDLVARIAF